MFCHVVRLIVMFGLSSIVAQTGILFPQTSETRELISLDGLWNFALEPDGEILLMPVPSSYNDITQSVRVRDHVGKVRYSRTFFVPKSWVNQTVWLRFSSVNYKAKVTINDQLSMTHRIGHLPFHADVTKFLKFGEENDITVICDNRLSSITVPQGRPLVMETENGIIKSQSYEFDFFNYAGIHRSVTLYTTPKIYIDDITIHTKVVDSTGYVTYNITYTPQNSSVYCRVILTSKEGEIVASEDANFGTLTVENATFWWPYLMDPNPGYLYTLKVLLTTDDGSLLDVYRLQIGIRELAWSNTTDTINGKPLYLHGFGRHEDADIRGKGLDFPTIIKDHILIQWVGANVYRTSHYPYAEDTMDVADRLGIMIVDECPSSSLEVPANPFVLFDDVLNEHKRSLTELVNRDKNHPSVIAWSLANEPSSTKLAGNMYFKELSQHVKSLDQSRPLTMALAQHLDEYHVAQYVDIIGFNRYNGWYSNPGYQDMITSKVVEEAISWFERYNKPVMMLEYGADTLEGLHIHPEFIWSEEYQVQLMSKHFKAFDILRKKGFFVGEFIWNFADFKTAQTYTRVGCNKKGIFTRNRQPKASAHHLRRRYFKLAKELYNATLPNDLYYYTIDNHLVRDEL